MNGDNGALARSAEARRSKPHKHIPLIEAAVRVQTQHVPVIQAKRLQLPHPPVKRSTGRNSRGFRRRPQATWHRRRRLVSSVPELLPGRHSWTSDFNPPRTTTSLLAASSSRAGNPPVCFGSRLTAGGPSPGICFYWAAGAVSFGS